MEHLVSRSSDKLLGAPNRLAVAAVVARLPERFSTGDAVQKLRGIGQSVVSRNLDQFVEGGVLERVKRGEYRRIRSAYWVMAPALLKELEGRHAPTRLRSVQPPESSS